MHTCIAIELIASVAGHFAGAPHRSHQSRIGRINETHQCHVGLEMCHRCGMFLDFYIETALDIEQYRKNENDGDVTHSPCARLGVV